MRIYFCFKNCLKHVFEVNVLIFLLWKHLNYWRWFFLPKKCMNFYTIFWNGNFPPFLYRSERLLLAFLQFKFFYWDLSAGLFKATVSLPYVLRMKLSFYSFNNRIAISILSAAEMTLYEGRHESTKRCLGCILRGFIFQYSFYCQEYFQEQI